MPPRLGFDRRRARDEGPDAAIELKNLLEPHLSGSEYEHACELIDALAENMGGDEPHGTRDTPRPGGAMDSYRFAMDSAGPGRIVADLNNAIAQVEPVVGRAAILACDSAASVFRTALAQLGVDARDLPASALPTMWNVTRRGHGAQSGGAGGHSLLLRPYTPASVSADFARNFPDAARIRSLG